MGRDSKKRKKAFLFLVKLGIGWIIGFGLSVLILASLFERQHTFREAMWKTDHASVSYAGSAGI